MTIVIVYRLDTNGYTTETCKETGRNGRRKNIGTDTVIMIAEGMGIVIAEDEENKTAGGMVIKTVGDTKNGIKWMMDWDLMSDSKVYFSLYQVA